MNIKKSLEMLRRWMILLHEKWIWALVDEENVRSRSYRIRHILLLLSGLFYIDFVIQTELLFTFSCLLLGLLPLSKKIIQMSTEDETNWRRTNINNSRYLILQPKWILNQLNLLNVDAMQTNAHFSLQQKRCIMSLLNYYDRFHYFWLTTEQEKKEIVLIENWLGKLFAE